MPTPTLIATIGAVDANSFGTLAEADLYHDSVLHTDVPWPSNISASITIGSGTNGLITITADPGTDGNDLTIVVVLGATPSLPLSVVRLVDAITVTLGTDGSGLADSTKNTAILVAGEIEGITGILSASASGTGASQIPVTSVQSFSGGSSLEATKIPALIMAQQQMTSLINWSGFVTSLTQKLPWPRNGMWGRNEMQSIPDNVIPDEVKWAQFELARLLINGDRTEEFDIDTNGITHLRAGPVTLKFKEYNNYGPGVIPQAVWGLLVPSWFSTITGVPQINLDLERA